MPSSIVDPVEQDYWNELVCRREEMNKENQKVHNYRMTVQEVPIVSAKLTLKGKEYPIWLLGSEAYCYAPGLSEEFENCFGYSEAEKQKEEIHRVFKDLEQFYPLSKLTMSLSYCCLLHCFKMPFLE